MKNTIIIMLMLCGIVSSHAQVPTQMFEKGKAFEKHSKFKISRDNAPEKKMPVFDVAQPGTPHTQPTNSLTQPGIPHNQPGIPHSQPVIPQSQLAISHTRLYIPQSQPTISHAQPDILFTQLGIPRSQLGISLRQPSLQHTQPDRKHRQPTAETTTMYFLWYRLSGGQRMKFILGLPFVQFELLYFFQDANV